MPNDTSIAPIAFSERYDLVDALRGFALCGVLLANISTFTLYAYMSEQALAALPTARFDSIAKDALELLLHHKAVTVFSILFGFGFAMQLERAEARGGNGMPVFLRRMAVLLVLGIAHSAFWWGDILITYAIAGFALILFRRCPDRWLVWSGFAIALLGTALMRVWFMASAAAGPLTQPQVFAETLRLLSSPSLSAAFQGNAVVQGWFQPLGGLMLVLFALGRFLLGYWAGRHRLLQVPAAHLPLLKRILVWTLALGAVATLLRFWGTPIKKALPMLGEGIGAVGWGVVALSGPLLVGIAFAAIFVLLYLRDGWRRWLRYFAPAGRMALSNYLAQTAICTAIFYGYGLGVGPAYGMATCFVAWALLFGAQMAFSHWWLNRFRFGPMEWLWRTLSYGRLQPMRLQASAFATQRANIT